jgi:spoIIIJ-associated protein
MASIEITAKTLAEAKKRAAAELGVQEGALRVTVLEETKGLFGKGQVRILAEGEGAAKPASKPAGKAAARAPEPEPEPAPEAAKAPEEAPAKPERRGGRIGAKAKKAIEEGPTPEIEAITDAFEEEPPAQGAPESTEERQVSATQEDADALLGILNGLLDKAGLTVDAKVTNISDRYVNIELDGQDVAFLVGKHGEVLNATQYLVNIIAARKLGNGVRATLDGNDYRRRREDQLNQYATRIAQEVKQRGEEAVLDALPAFERRIVHKALSGLTGITTYSEGEEPNRRVVIAPAE